MKHLIMGTAGHVDHGKTALIKALTGVDCDTHKEEKARGITINLGFTHLDLPGGDSLGVVDVPGHRDFVHTMVGGATGIDIALLIVAADSGVMPQTVEHLQIMDVLGIRNGLAALTKTDLAEPEICDLAEEEIRDLVGGTFLEGCPIVRVSAVTGEGVELLTRTISEAAATVEDRPAGEVFRLFPDRVFSKSGFGTIVTGSVVGGSLAAGERVFLLPGANQFRIRRMQRHGANVDRVVAGDRASLNLVGLKRESFRRGMALSDRVLPDTKMIDAELRLFRHAWDFKLWTQVVFHFGTYEHQARIHLMDRDRLAGGETGLVQVHLDEPCVAQYGDRFVIRSTANDITLGGGKIIDPTPLHHRRRTARAIEGMAKIAKGKLPELMAAEIRKRFRAVGHRELADILNISVEEMCEIVSGELPEDIVRYAPGDEVILALKGEHDRLRTVCLKSIAAYHRRHPLEQGGRSLEELASTLGLSHDPASETMLKMLVHNLANERKIKRISNTWALAEHTAQIGRQMAGKIQFVDEFLRNCRMQLPVQSELLRATETKHIDRRELKEILRYLVREGRAYYFEGDYIHAATVNRCRDLLLRALAESTGSMTVARFRDLVGGNRRICVPLLGLFDAEGVTERVGDDRVLTEKGRAHLRGNP